MKSRIRLFAALEELLQTKPIDEIPIREICTKAGVSKSTFYTYFEDKYDIARWYSLLAHEVGAGQIGRTLTWREGHAKTTSALMKKITMLNKAVRSQDAGSINPFMQRWREQRMKETLVKYRHETLTKKLSYQITALAAAETKISNEYFNSNDDTRSIEEFVDIMMSIVPRDLYAALERPIYPGQIDEETREKQFALLLLQGSEF